MPVLRSTPPAAPARATDCGSSKPAHSVHVRNHVVRPGREERVFGDQQHAVGRAVVDRAVLAGVDDHAHRVRDEVQIPPRVGEADVVVAAAEVGRVVEEGVADFDVAALGFDERGDAEHVGGRLAVVEGGAGDLVEAGEERDVVVRPIEPGAVAGRDRRGDADDRVFHPHAVLEQQRDQAGGDGRSNGA